MREYTAQDFQNVKFAEHESGRAIAVRWTGERDQPDAAWCYERPTNNLFTKEATSKEMADMGGWVPVPAKPTITQTKINQACDNLMMSDAAGDFVGGARRLAEELGVEIVPDPTNAEKLAEIIESERKNHGRGIVIGDKCDSVILGEILDSHGVKADCNK